MVLRVLANSRAGSLGMNVAGRIGRGDGPDGWKILDA